MGQCRGLGRRSGRERRRIPVDHRPKPAGPEWLGRVEGRPPGELGWGVRREPGVIPLGGLARIELGWPLRGCRYGGDPPSVGSGEAWLEEQAGGGGLGQGVRIQGVRLPGEGLGGGRKPAPYRGGGNPEGPQIRGRGCGEPLGVRVPCEGAGNWVGLGWGPGASPAHTGCSRVGSDSHGVVRSCSWWAVTAVSFGGRGRKASTIFAPSLLGFGETAWCVLEPLKPVAWDLQDPRTQGRWLCSGDAAPSCCCLLVPARAGDGGDPPLAPDPQSTRGPCLFLGGGVGVGGCLCFEF